MQKRTCPRSPFLDYGQSGWWFVTIAVKNRRPVLGRVVRGEMVRSPAGELVAAEWTRLPQRFPGIELRQWMVMPEHFHGLVRTADPSAVIRAFKSASSAAIHRELGIDFAWQRSWWDRWVRSNEELERIGWYIRTNPQRYGEGRGTSLRFLGETFPKRE